MMEVDRGSYNNNNSSDGILPQLLQRCEALRKLSPNERPNDTLQIFANTVQQLQQNAKEKLRACVNSNNNNNAEKNSVAGARMHALNLLQHAVEIGNDIRLFCLGTNNNENNNNSLVLLQSPLIVGEMLLLIRETHVMLRDLFTHSGATISNDNLLAIQHAKEAYEIARRVSAIAQQERRKQLLNTNGEMKRNSFDANTENKLTKMEEVCNILQFARSEMQIAVLEGLVGKHTKAVKHHRAAVQMLTSISENNNNNNNIKDITQVTEANQLLPVALYNLGCQLEQLAVGDKIETQIKQELQNEMQTVFEKAFILAREHLEPTHPLLQQLQDISPQLQETMISTTLTRFPVKADTIHQEKDKEIKEVMKKLKRENKDKPEELLSWSAAAPPPVMTIINNTPRLPSLTQRNLPNSFTRNHNNNNHNHTAATALPFHFGLDEPRPPPQNNNNGLLFTNIGSVTMPVSLRERIASLPSHTSSSSLTLPLIAGDAKRGQHKLRRGSNAYTLNSLNGKSPMKRYSQNQNNQNHLSISLQNQQSLQEILRCHRLRRPSDALRLGGVIEVDSLFAPKEEEIKAEKERIKEIKRQKRRKRRERSFLPEDWNIEEDAPTQEKKKKKKKNKDNENKNNNMRTSISQQLLKERGRVTASFDVTAIIEGKDIQQQQEEDKGKKKKKKMKKQKERKQKYEGEENEEEEGGKELSEDVVEKKTKRRKKCGQETVDGATSQLSDVSKEKKQKQKEERESTLRNMSPTKLIQRQNKITESESTSSFIFGDADAELTDSSISIITPDDNEEAIERKERKIREKKMKQQQQQQQKKNKKEKENQQEDNEEIKNEDEVKVRVEDGVLIEEKKPVKVPVILESEEEESEEEEEEEESEDEEEEEESEDEESEESEEDEEKETVEESKERCETELINYFNIIYTRRMRAACKIQCAWRSHCARIALHQRQQILYREVYRKQKAAVMCIEGFLSVIIEQRKLRTRQEININSIESRIANERVLFQAALIIARYAAKFLIRRRRERELCEYYALRSLEELKLRAVAATIISRWWKIIPAQKAYWRRRNIEIQEEKRIAEILKQKENAAISIQRIFRGILGRKEAKQIKEKQIEEHRARQAQLRDCTDLVRLCLQEYNKRLARIEREKNKQILQNEEAAIIIQLGWRAALKKQMLQNVLFRCRRIVRAVLTIQRAYRRFQAGREIRYLRRVQIAIHQERIEKEYILYRATIKLQCFARMILAKRQARHRKAAIGRGFFFAAIEIQKMCRGGFTRIQLGYTLQLQRKTQLQLQIYLQQQRENTAAILFAFLNAYHSKYITENKRCRRLTEKLFLRRYVRRELHKDKCAIIIQRACRRWIKRRREKEAKHNAEIMRTRVLNCVIRIQAIMRGYLTRQKYKEIKFLIYKQQIKREEMEEVMIQIWIDEWRAAQLHCEYERRRIETLEGKRRELITQQCKMILNNNYNYYYDDNYEIVQNNNCDNDNYCEDMEKMELSLSTYRDEL